MTARWPRMMKRATAAEYCDLSEPAFEREIASGRIPDGVVFGGRLHWYRTALDAALDVIAGEVPNEHIARFEERRRGKAA